MSARDQHASTPAFGRGVASGAAHEEAEIECFFVQVVPGGTETILKLFGELDMAGARLLKSEVEVLLESGPHRIIVDVSELTFIDTTGTKALLDTRRGTPDRLTILGAQGLVRGYWTRLRDPRRSWNAHPAS